VSFHAAVRFEPEPAGLHLGALPPSQLASQLYVISLETIVSIRIRLQRFINLLNQVYVEVLQDNLPRVTVPVKFVDGSLDSATEKKVSQRRSS
jgi:hypothetical protein